MNRLNLKKSKKVLFLTLLVGLGIGLFSSVTLMSCDDGGTSKSSQSKNYNGTYYWSYDNGNTDGSHIITIRGTYWSSTLRFLSRVTYDNGYLEGTTLINSEGINVGYISDNSIYYNYIMSHVLIKDGYNHNNQPSKQSHKVHQDTIVDKRNINKLDSINYDDMMGDWYYADIMKKKSESLEYLTYFKIFQNNDEIVYESKHATWSSNNGDKYIESKGYVIVNKEKDTLFFKSGYWDGYYVSINGFKKTYLKICKDNSSTITVKKSVILPKYKHIIRVVKGHDMGPINSLLK